MDILSLEDIEGMAQKATTNPQAYEERLLIAQTGIVSLDILLGGGLSPGVVEICGPPAAGKTALLGQIIAHNQKIGAWTLGLLSGEPVDKDYYKRLGVDLQDLAALNRETVFRFLSDNPQALLLIDTLGFLKDGLDLLEEIKERMRVNQTVVCTTQVRTRKSSDPRRMFMGQTRSAYSRAQDLFDVRLGIDRTEVSDFTYKMSVTILSNTIGLPFRYVLLPCRKGYGVNRLVDLVQSAAACGVLEKSGSFYKIDGVVLGHGLEDAVEYLRRDKQVESIIVERLVRST